MVTAAVTAAVTSAPAPQADPWRVALVTETYPPEVNGVATTVARLVEGLVANGHRVHLVRPRQRTGEVALLSARLTETLVSGWPLPKYPGLRLGLPCAGLLERQWRQTPPDVVHIATEGPLGWSARRAARRLGLPTTSDFRTNFHTYAAHYGLGWLQRPVLAALRSFHNGTGATMVPTEALRSSLQAEGFERLHVVGRGVDTARFAPQQRRDALRAAWGVQADDLVLTCVGRLAAEKNLETVMQAYAAVRAEQPRARLVLVGDGPLRERVQQQCPEVILAGYRSGDDLAAHYASADLFTFASLTETFGNVTTEALASGLPVVAFDHAAAGQLIRSGDNGVLVPGADPAPFVQAVLALARDADGRRRLGAAARQTALRIGWQSVLQQFEQVLSRSIDDQRARTDRWPDRAGFSDTHPEAMPMGGSGLV